MYMKYLCKILKIFRRYDSGFIGNLMHTNDEQLHWSFVVHGAQFVVVPCFSEHVQLAFDNWQKHIMQTEQVKLIVWIK